MEGADPGRATHVLVIPYPRVGHLNPMLLFSRRLARKGVRVTLLTTMAVANSLPSHPGGGGVSIDLISDGSANRENVSIESHLRRFEVIISESLEGIIKKHNRSTHPVEFLVYDSLLPSALDVAQQLGLGAAPFFTQSCAASAIYYHARHGTLEMPPKGPAVSMPSLPLLEISDLPSFVSDVSSYPNILNMVLGRFSNFQKANWLFFNTFDKLEDEVLNWMKSQWPVKTIGPTIPSMFLDKRLEDDKDYGLNLFKPDADTCMKWLDTKEAGSVVYVSFGSLAALGEQQMEELSHGLIRSSSYFLWVVRESELNKLSSNFVERASEKGLVITWCPQLEVLAHKAVGCFVTHCGWNSTLEALSLGVPMVAMPQWSDQTTNAKFVADVWGVGIRVKMNERGLVTREEVELHIREIMEGERRNEIKKNAERWKELAREAVDEGGSSDKNIDEFVAELERI